eukprot:s1288_g12.t1
MSVIFCSAFPSEFLWDVFCAAECLECPVRSFLYVAAELEEPKPWATLREHDSVIFHDNDFEVFVDANATTHYYKEFEMNAFNTTWMFVVPADALNDPSKQGKHWTVEIALPLASLVQETGAALPQPGTFWRINFSRVQWHLKVNPATGKYEKNASCQSCPSPGSPNEDNWVWSPQYEIAMHLPERWGILQFEDSLETGASYYQEWPSRSAAIAIYYAEHAYASEHRGNYTAVLAELLPYSSDPFPICSEAETFITASGGEHSFFEARVTSPAAPQYTATVSMLREALRGLADDDGCVAEEALQNVAGFESVAATLEEQLGCGPWHVARLEELFFGTSSKEEDEEDHNSRKADVSPVRLGRFASPPRRHLPRRHTVSFAEEAHRMVDGEDVDEEWFRVVGAVEEALREDEEQDAAQLMQLLRRTFQMMQSWHHQRQSLQEQFDRAAEQAKLQSDRADSAETARLAAEAAEAATVAQLEEQEKRLVQGRETIKSQKHDLEEARHRIELQEVELREHQQRLKLTEGSMPSTPQRPLQRSQRLSTQSKCGRFDRRDLASRGCLGQALKDWMPGFFLIELSFLLEASPTKNRGILVTCFITLLAQILIISLCSSSEPLALMSLKVSPTVQVLSASWALVGIPMVICAGVGVLYHVDHLLRAFFWYLLFSLPLGIAVPTWLLASGKVCSSVVEDEVQRLGPAFVCGFTEGLDGVRWLYLRDKGKTMPRVKPTWHFSVNGQHGQLVNRIIFFIFFSTARDPAAWTAQESFVFMWMMVAGLVQCYLVYVVWSAAEEISEIPNNSVALTAYANKLQFLASMGLSQVDSKSVPVLNPGYNPFSSLLSEGSRSYGAASQPADAEVEAEVIHRASSLRQPATSNLKWPRIRRSQLPRSQLPKSRSKTQQSQKRQAKQRAQWIQLHQVHHRASSPHHQATWISSPLHERPSVVPQTMDGMEMTDKLRRRLETYEEKQQQSRATTPRVPDGQDSLAKKLIAAEAELEALREELLASEEAAALEHKRASELEAALEQSHREFAEWKEQQALQSSKRRAKQGGPSCRSRSFVELASTPLSEDLQTMASGDAAAGPKVSEQNGSPVVPKLAIFDRKARLQAQLSRPSPGNPQPQRPAADGA